MAIVTLVRGHFAEKRPALLLLPRLEEASASLGRWAIVDGPLLFSPMKLSTRVYSFLHTALSPFLRAVRRRGAILSLGLPYFHYLTGKTFPHFAYGYDLRVLWTYDVWEPDFDYFCEVVRRARIDLLLVSSFQVAEQLRNRLTGCEVHWLPEFINAEDYPSKPWHERTVDILSFGRAFPRYDNAIKHRCLEAGINYVSDRSFPDWAALADALSDAKLCVCFPRATTNPDSAGSISTLTFRYLQAMAAGAVPIGEAPSDVEKLFDYPAVINVDWSDPVEQIRQLLGNPEPLMSIRERNFAAVKGPLHVRAFVDRTNDLVEKRLAR